MVEDLRLEEALTVVLPSPVPRFQPSDHRHELPCTLTQRAFRSRTQKVVMVQVFIPTIPGFSSFELKNEFIVDGYSHRLACTTISRRLTTLLLPCIDCIGIKTSEARRVHDLDALDVTLHVDLKPGGNGSLLAEAPCLRGIEGRWLCAFRWLDGFVDRGRASREQQGAKERTYDANRSCPEALVSPRECWLSACALCLWYAGFASRQRIPRPHR